MAEPPETIRSTVSALALVHTIRRIWCAALFLGVALFGVQNLLSLVYEEVFGLSSLARGWIAAGVEPLQIAGVFLIMPWVKVAMRDPGYLLRFIGLVGVADAICLVILAYAPTVWLAIAMPRLLAASIGTLAPAFYALLSLVAPAAVRAAGLTTITVLAVPGIAVFFPLIGRISTPTACSPACW